MKDRPDCATVPCVDGCGIVWKVMAYLLNFDTDMEAKRTPPLWEDRTCMLLGHKVMHLHTCTKPAALHWPRFKSAFSRLPTARIPSARMHHTHTHNYLNLWPRACNTYPRSFVTCACCLNICSAVQHQLNNLQVVVGNSNREWLSADLCHEEKPESELEGFVTRRNRHLTHFENSCHRLVLN